jgi:hypothetical protein
MDLLPKTQAKLKDVWADPQTKQDAQMVLVAAFRGIDVSMIDVETFLGNLNEMLDTREEAPIVKRDPAL